VPGLDETTIQQRWVFAVELAQRALGHVADMAVSAGMRGRRSARALENYLQDMVRFIVGGLCEKRSVGQPASLCETSS